MDPVTHTLVGVGMANAFFRRRAGRESVPILAIASNLPDLDAVVHLTGSPAALLMRRTFGHSILLVPIWSLLLALLLRRIYPGAGLSRPHVLLRLYGLILLGAGVHLFFDLINSFGVVLLWPFSDWRPELAIVFIIDLVLTGLLALPLLLALIPSARPSLAGLSRAALACVALYLVLCGTGRHLAGRALAREAATLERPPDFAYVFPEPLGPHRWRGVLREGDLYRVYLVRSLSGQVQLKEEIRTRTDDPRVEEVRRSAFGRRLERFFKAPVWQVSRAPLDGATRATAEVNVYDLRFISLLLERKHVFEYNFTVDQHGRVADPGSPGP